LDPNTNYATLATGGDGHVCFYSAGRLDITKSFDDWEDHQRSYMPALAHEMGHNLAYSTYNNTAPHSASNYAKAQAAESPVSAYGATKSAEDFAEAVRRYVVDPKGFEKSHPQKYKALHDILHERGDRGAPEPEAVGLDINF
jgi:hypothetical protein